MKHVKVLDCTLRDGGYVNDARFGRETIKGIISRLSEAGVDIIECGFLKDKPLHEQDDTNFNDVRQVLEYLPEGQNGRGTSYVLLADCSRYKATDLTPYCGYGVDGIRECFQKVEKEEALQIAAHMKELGYRVYIQPVDILGYSDRELLDLIEAVNELEPYAFSMVDTFGSMYVDDLRRLYSLVHHNLRPNIQIGFHSHNNLQMSFALSQEFITMSHGQREVIVDATMCGMGRGAGNTNTELVVDYLNRKLQYTYDIDGVLDVVDVYMLPIINQYQWGYSIPNFIAGMYSTHVHNISYLTDKHNINSRSMRKIIESLDNDIRKKYDYDNLENVYIDYFNKDVDDIGIRDKLRKELIDKEIMILASGSSLKKEKSKIVDYIQKTNPIVIAVNAVYEEYDAQYAFYSNFRRLEWAIEQKMECLQKHKVLLTSNIVTDYQDVYALLNYNNIIKRGWKHFDSSVILLLRFLFSIGIRKVTIAGFDGYSLDKETENYSEPQYELSRESEIFASINRETKEMLSDLFEQYELQESAIQYLTASIYQ